MAIRARLHTVSIVAITALAAALRLFSLGSKSLWLDEAASVVLGRIPPTSVWHAIWHPGLGANLFYLYMSGYYFLLHGWMHFGVNEFWLRLPSALFGIAAAPLLYLLGARLFSRGIGLAAALLLAVDPFHIAHSQEARSYSLLALGAILSFLFFARAVAPADHARQHNQQRELRWILYVLASLAAIASHLYAVLIFPAQWLSLVFRKRNEIPWRPLLAATAIIVIVAAPICLLALGSDTGQNSWRPQMHAKDVLHGSQTLTGAGIKFPIFLALFVLAGLPRKRIPTSEPMTSAGERTWPKALVWLWLVLPVALIFWVSAIKPPFIPRYLMVSLPAALLVAGVGLERLGRFMAPATLILAAIMASSLPSYYSRPREDWRAATQFVLAAQQPHDAVVFLQPYGQHPFEYYCERMGRAGPRVIPTLMQASSAHEPGGGGGSLSVPRRIWFVLYAEDNTPAGPGQAVLLESALAAQHHLLERRHFASVDVLLYGR